jgi:hypothetical protein
VPADLKRLDVDLEERLSIRVEQLRILEARVGGREARAHHQDGVGVGYDLVRSTACPQLPKTPRASAWVSVIALLPVAVVATGMPAISANRARDGQAREACTPLPAMITGLPARSSVSATRATSSAAGLVTLCARYRAVANSRGGRSVLIVPASERLLKMTATGPGLPLVACLMASCSVCTACLGSDTAAVYFVTLAKRFRRSWLPYSPVPA